MPRFAPLLAASAGVLLTGAQPRTDTAVLAGGCFWGMEAVFEHVKGVQNVVSGYAGGAAGDASYQKVSSERTGHAEAIRISFDPRQVSYAQLLRIYFSVAHDPTQLNRQGPDVGPSYRSAIFPQNAEQRRRADSFITQLRAAKKPIATRIESGPFYPAEASHQDFVRRNPLHPYVVVNDRPKLAKLKRTYPQYWKA
jgi:peptide-methionine (S)-S-oxide reductase